MAEKGRLCCGGDAAPPPGPAQPPAQPRAAGAAFPRAAAVGAAVLAPPEGAHSGRLPGADGNRGTNQKVSQKNPPRSPVHIAPSPREIPAPESECLYAGAAAAGFPRRGGAGRCGAVRLGQAAPQPPAAGLQRCPSTGGRDLLPRAGEPTEIKVSI